MSWFKKQVEASSPPSSEQIHLVTEALDCSWCAAEQGKPTTDSPDICTFHRNQMLEVAQERAARRQRKV